MRTIASIRQDILNRAYELIHMTGGDTAGRGGTCTLEELYANVIHFAKKSDNLRLPKPYITGIRKAELQDFEDYLDKFIEMFSYHGLIPTKKFTFNYDALLLKHANSQKQLISDTIDDIGIKEPETGKNEGTGNDGTEGSSESESYYQPEESTKGNKRIEPSGGLDEKKISIRCSSELLSDISSGIENNTRTSCRRDTACSPIQFEPIQTSPTSAIGPTPTHTPEPLSPSTNPPGDIQKESPNELSSRPSATPQPKASSLLNISNQIGHNSIQSIIPQRLKIF